MIERVARALNAYASGPEVTDPAPAWDEIGEIERNEWRGEARAALTAIREPTEAMCEAAFNDGWVASTTSLEDFARWYIAMIDAALLR